VTLLDRVSGRLDDEGIQHALIGAAALAAAGVARSTFDVDLLVTDTRCLIDTIWEPMTAEGVEIEIRRGDASDPLAGVVRIVSAPDRPVDLIVGRSAWQQDILARARRHGAGPPVVRPADLVLLKLFAGGAQDLWDIQQLLGLREAREWIPDVDAHITELPGSAQERWKTIKPA
jgi:hypothetical protein